MATPSRPPGTASGSGSSRYRGLIAFWGVVLLLLGGGGAVLEALGPLPPSEPAFAARPIVAAAATPAQPLIPPPDAALMEAAPDEPGRNLPIVGPDGRAPMTVYAAHVDPADKHPRVAMVIDGAGLDQAMTLRLLTDLPPAVDVAFSAYMPEELEESLTAKARQTGHECLVSLPMEPSEAPLREEGERSLMTGQTPEHNHLNLEWALSRETGCVGATGASDGLAGERFAQTQGLGDVLNEVTKRGLLYLDPRTGAPDLGDVDSDLVRVATLTVDASPNGEPVTAELIDRQLGVLEHEAAVHGWAIGLAGPPKPVLLERIAVWANGLPAHGISLVPLTAIPAPPKPPSEN